MSIEEIFQKLMENWSLWKETMHWLKKKCLHWNKCLFIIFHALFQNVYFFVLRERFGHTAHKHRLPFASSLLKSWYTCNHDDCISRNQEHNACPPRLAAGTELRTPSQPPRICISRRHPGIVQPVTDVLIRCPSYEHFEVSLHSKCYTQ